MTSLRHVPRSIAFEVLWGCNLRCDYCYVGVEKNWLSPEIPTISVVERVIRALRDAGVQELFLVGGEPLSHPRIEEVCTLIERIGFPVRGVCTNGTLVTRGTAQLLRKLGFYVDVSFRGGTPEVFDLHSGITGSFERALNGCKVLAGEGHTVGIEFVSVHGVRQLFRS